MQGRLEELADEESQIYDSVQTGERLDQAEQTETVSEAIPEPPTETFEPTVQEQTVQEPAMPEPAAAAPEQAPTPAVFADAAPEQAAERGGPQEMQREPVTIPPEPVAVPPGTPVPPPAPEYNIPEPPPEPPKSDWLARMTSQ